MIKEKAVRDYGEEFETDNDSKGVYNKAGTAMYYSYFFPTFGPIQISFKENPITNWV